MQELSEKTEQTQQNLTNKMRNNNFKTSELEKIAAAYKVACSDPEIIKKIEDLGNLMTYKGPADTGALFAGFDKVFAKNLKK